MTILQLILSGILLGIVPCVIGTLFYRLDEDSRSLPFYWVSGQVLLWAGFLFISIPLILRQKSFTLTCICFGIYTGVLLAAALVILAVRWGKRVHRSGLPVDSDCVKRAAGTRRQGIAYLLWGIAGVLLILQLVLTVCMAYEEGDDAYYVAISTITESSDTMYRILPYTGSTTGLDARHGLAPFPVWVAAVARATGIPSVTVAQIVLPVVLICMAYGIYYLLAKRLFRGDFKKMGYFLILMEVLVLFGGYSTYSAENFLLVRASQGKAVIANIILPFLVYLMLVLLEGIQARENGEAKAQKQVGFRFWLLMGLTMAAGCLCSTLGTFLTCMLVGIVGLCSAVCYRKWKLLFPMAACCVVPVVMALLYFVIE